MKREVIQPPTYEKADVMAFKALAAGNANEHQQKRVLDWIIYQASGYYEISFRPGYGGDRDTAFSEGRRFVGQQVVKLVNYSGDLLNEAFKQG